MHIFLNNQEIDLLEGETLKELLIRQEIACQGTAVAVNNRVIGKDVWETTCLCDQDKLTVIRASCGG